MKNGGDEGDRTPNLRIAIAALSQLSYIPTLIVTVKYIKPGWSVKGSFVIPHFRISCDNR